MAIERDEFQDWMELLREDIKGVHDRLDGLNGRTRRAEEHIAVLNDRSSKANDPTARWGAGLAVGAGVLMEIVHRVWGVR